MATNAVSASLASACFPRRIAQPRLRMVWALSSGVQYRGEGRAQSTAKLCWLGRRCVRLLSADGRRMFDDPWQLC
jgi:hypothetical protein